MLVYSRTKSILFPFLILLFSRNCTSETFVVFNSFEMIKYLFSLFASNSIFHYSLYLPIHKVLVAYGQLAVVPEIINSYVSRRHTSYVHLASCEKALTRAIYCRSFTLKPPTRRVLHTKRPSNQNVPFAYLAFWLAGKVAPSVCRRSETKEGVLGRKKSSTFQQLSSFLTAGWGPWGHYYPKWREIGKASQHMFIAEDP